MKGEGLEVTQNNENKVLVDATEFKEILSKQQELTNAISKISERLNQESTLSEIKVDEQSLTTDKNGVLKIKDINKTDINNVGTCYIYDTKMPISLKENTKYVIANNINEQIKLPKGSKIVPNGGIPICGVDGGEYSWVHSSDIGMIQDDGSHNVEIGKHNRQIFEYLLNTRFNLILDGAYYIHIPYSTNNVSTYALQLNRDFSLKNGHLFIKDTFMTINNGASFHAENVTFERVDNSYGYAAIYFSPKGSLIKNVEFIDCKFLSNELRRFTGSSVKTTCPEGFDAYKMWDTSILEENGYNNAILNSTGTYVYAFPKEYKRVEVKGDISTYYIVNEKNEKIAEKKWDSIALERHSTSYFGAKKCENGDVCFVANGSGSDIYDGKLGYFSLEKYVTSSDIKYIIAQKFCYVEDKTAQKSAAMGIDTFIMHNCYANNVYFGLGDMMFKTKFEVSNCTFDNVKISEFNLGSNNVMPYSNDWCHMSCQYVFLNCKFNGPNKVIKKTSDNYTCGILAEGNSILVKGCEFKNMVSNRYATYECYLSCGEVIFEDNYVYNVFSVPRNTIKDSTGNNKFYSPSFEWMKSKGAPVINGRNPSRVYKNNHFEIDYDTAWLLCEEYLRSMYTDENDDIKEIFENYCMRQRIFGFISKSSLGLYVEGNTFKIPKGKLINVSQSGKGGLFREISIKNNIFDIGKYENDFSQPIVSIRSVEDNYPLNVEVIGNTFTSREKSNVQLISTDTDVKLDKLYIQNNVFNNTIFKLSNYSDGVGRSSVNVNEVFIDNNIYNSPNGIISELSHKGKINGNLSGDLFFIKPTDYCNINIYDNQKNNNFSECSKIILVPQTNGVINVTIPHMQRRLSLDSKGFTDENNSTLCLYWSKLGNITYGIDISYVFKGRKVQRHMELSHTSANSYYATVVRDHNGTIHGLYSLTDFTFNNIPVIDDIGLGIFCEGKSLTGINGNFAMHFYTTNEDGSHNDCGSNININVKQISESGIYTPNKTPNINNLTPMRFFVCDGSNVTAEWLNATENGMQYKGSSKMINVPVMTKNDVGLKVISDGKYYIWNGENWVIN